MWPNVTCAIALYQRKDVTRSYCLINNTGVPVLLIDNYCTLYMHLLLQFPLHVLNDLNCRPFQDLGLDCYKVEQMFHHL